MNENSVVVKRQDEIEISLDDDLVFLLTQTDAYGEEQTVWFNFDCAEVVAAAIIKLHRQSRKGE